MTSLRRRRLLVLLPLLGLVSCGGSDDPEETSTKTAAEVAIKTFAFAPDPLRVPAGTTITFRNQDKINHSVTAGTRAAPKPSTFDHVLAEAGATYELVLDEPGTYAYFCKFHPGEGMTAEIIVE